MAVKKKPSAKISKKAKKKAPLRIPCVTFEQAGTTFAFFVCSGKQLWSVVQVNERKEDDGPDGGYQRIFSKSRIAKISKFIESKGSIPLSVLVAFDRARILNNKIIIENRKDAGWVIDGQHRIIGAAESKVEMQIPVIASIGMDLKDQMNHFVTINKEQKGVPSSLYMELRKYLPGDKAEKAIREEMAADLANICKRDENSPFYGRIVSTSSPTKGQISVTNWVRKIAPLLERDSSFLTIPFDGRAQVLSNYYRAIGIVFPSEFGREDSVFFKTIGFGALFNIFRFVFDTTARIHKGVQVQDFVKVLSQAKGFDFNQWRQQGTGNQAELFAGDELKTFLSEEIEVDPSHSLRY